MSDRDVARDDDLTALFRATILEHSRFPRNQGATLAGPYIERHGVNASCGDRVTLRLSIDDEDVVSAIEWDGEGCAISQASISMMTRAVRGKSLTEVAEIIAAFRAFLTGDAIPTGMALGELEALAGVRQYPVRIKCALLGWYALEDCLAVHARSRQ